MSKSRQTSNLGTDQFVSARRTESVDAAAVSKLVNNTTEQVFGRVNVINLIERSNLAVTLVNQDDELMAQACFLDYPNIPDVDPGKWEGWLPEKYNKTKPCGSLNTLFMHFFVARGEYSHGASQEIITTVFNAVPEVHYIYLVVPKNSYPEAALSNIFTQVDLAGSPGLDNHVLFLCGREKYVPMLHVRQARVQDHDDLTPIFDKQSDMLSNTYGDFFLAELIEAQDESMHCLVSEIEGTAVGFMSLCHEVNLDLLNKCFDLGPLHGLRKPHIDDILRPEPTPEGEFSMTSMKSKTYSNTQNARPISVHEHNQLKPTTAVAMLEIEEVIQPSKPLSSKSVRSDTSGKSVGGKQLTKEKGEIAIQRKLSEEMLEYMSDVSGSLSTSRASSVMDKPESSIDGAIEEPLPDSEPTPIEPSLPPAPSKFVPQYFGESNSFSIQLFCIDEQYEMRSLDLLREAFTRMPDKEFAVMTVPHLVPEFPLLQKFLKVTPRVTSNLSQELYVFNRMGLTEDFIVRDAVKADTEGIENLVSTLSHRDHLLADLEQYLAARRDQDGTELRTYVAVVAEQVVGVSIIRAEEDIEYIRSHYNIEDFIYYNHHGRTEHAHLHHFALNPIFNHFSKHFMKEILRKSHKTSMYYPVFAPSSTSQIATKHSRLTCMNELVPVRPRRQIIYPLDVMEDRAPSKRVLQKREPYALCHINRKLTLEPKVAINGRIVVVGASTVGLAFLETLIFCPHLKFNNLILISPHGLPGELGPDPLREELLSTEHCYNETDHANTSLRSWVTVVYGKMTKIDRKKKQVYVNGERLVSYDHLVIATGEQHQLPMPTGLESDTTVDFPPNNPDRWFVGQPPDNLFVINDGYDAAVALFWAEQNLVKKEPSGKVVVHGNSLRTYTTVQALIKLGVKSSDMVLVKGPEEGDPDIESVINQMATLNYPEGIDVPYSDPTCFNNQVVENAVTAALTDLGIAVKSGAVLADWSIDADNNATELSFLTPEGVFTTSCSALVSYTTKRVDLDAFKAINDACLVFDGKLVIDTTFHTNDISIRSAGSVTKYQRRYHAEPWTHKNFNSKEVGIELASNMLSLFDPTLEPMEEPEEDPLKLIPLYRSPKVQAGVLPGELHYLHIAKPSLEIPLAIQMMNPEYGTVIVTGEPAKSETSVDKFFRLHFNVYNTVETITCLSKQEIEASNILCLFGVHQRFLNNVMPRYKENLVSDFFKEAWALAIYHDRFSDFRDEIRELLVNQPASDVKALESKVRELIDEDLTLSEGQRKNLHDIYTDTSVKRAVETRLLSYLSYNYYHLPMYAKPGMV